MSLSIPTEDMWISVLGGSAIWNTPTLTIAGHTYDASDYLPEKRDVIVTQIRATVQDMISNASTTVEELLDYRRELKIRCKREFKEHERRMKPALTNIETHGRTLRTYSTEWYAHNRLQDFYFCNWRGIHYTIEVTYDEPRSMLLNEAKERNRKEKRRQYAREYYARGTIAKRRTTTTTM